MVETTDQNSSAAVGRILDLRMAAQAKIGIVLNEHFAADGTMRVMARRTAVAHRLVLEHHWAGLLAMAVGAAFILSRHGEAARRFHDVRAMRIVALRAIHPAFDDRMMLRQIELGVRFEMALETRGRVLAGIEDEFLPAARLDMQAARAMTGFAAAGTCFGIRHKMQARMWAGRKFLDNLGVAFVAGFIADESRTGNFRRRNYRPAQRRTRVQKQRQQQNARNQ